MMKFLNFALGSLLLSGMLLSAPASAAKASGGNGCAIICNDKGVCVNMCDPGVHP